MKNLLIIGARGFGREVYNLALESVGYGSEFVVKGFLDDKADALNGFNGYPSIVSSVENYEILPDDVFCCALGDVQYKKKYVEIVKNKGGKFISLIHSTSFISRNTTIGEGAIILDNNHISCDLTIGDFVTIQPFCAIGHDVRIGNFCHINAQSFLGGEVIVGDFVTLNTGAIVLPHKTVNTGATVGAGSVVLRNVPSNVTVYGNPAVKLNF